MAWARVALLPWLVSDRIEGVAPSASSPWLLDESQMAETDLLEAAQFACLHPWLRHHLGHPDAPTNSFIRSTNTEWEAPERSARRRFKWAEPRPDDETVIYVAGTVHRDMCVRRWPARFNRVGIGGYPLR
jgi:hypothetical protein